MAASQEVGERDGHRNHQGTTKRPQVYDFMRWDTAFWYPAAIAAIKELICVRGFVLGLDFTRLSNTPKNRPKCNCVMHCVKLAAATTIRSVRPPKASQRSGAGASQKPEGDQRIHRQNAAVKRIEFVELVQKADLLSDEKVDGGALLRLCTYSLREIGGRLQRAKHDASILRWVFCIVILYRDT